MRTRTKVVAATAAASGVLAVGAPLTASAADLPGLSVGDGAAQDLLEGGVNGDPTKKVEKVTEVVNGVGGSGLGVPLPGIGG